MGDLGLDIDKFKKNADKSIKKAIEKASLEELFNVFDLSELINLGDGMINESFDLAELMVNVAGKSTMAYWELHAAGWLRSLPRVDDVPGNYLNCGFNRAVQSTFGLGPILKAGGIGKNINPGSAVMGFWLGYVNFLMLVATTVDDWGMGNVPMTPPGANCGLPFAGDPGK